MSTQVLSDELAVTIDAVSADLNRQDATPVVTFAADTVLHEGYRATVNIREFGMTADEPPTIGGTNTGPTPVELVLAGLGTCQEIVYATYGRLLGIPIDGVSVHAEGRLDLRGFYGVADVPVGFEDVTFSVEIASAAPAEDVARLVAAVNAHCPVLDILRQPIPVAGSYRHNGEELVVAD
jgi:uncharacterized OsmC-like protein